MARILRIVRFILPAAILLSFIAAPDAVSSGGVITVCPSGPPACDYATIQAAVLAAVAGDVIQAAPGEYLGPVALKTGVRLVSTDGAASTTIATGYGPAVSYIGGSFSDESSLEGFTVRLSSPSSNAIAIGLYGGSLTVRDAIIRDVSGAPGDVAHPGGYSAAGVRVAGTAKLRLVSSAVTGIHGGDGLMYQPGGRAGGEAAGVWIEGDASVWLETVRIEDVIGGAAGSYDTWPYNCQGNGGDASGVRMTGEGRAEIIAADISRIVGGEPCHAPAYTCRSFAGGAAGVRVGGVWLVVTDSVFHAIEVMPSFEGAPAAGVVVDAGAIALIHRSTVRTISGNHPWSAVAAPVQPAARPDSPCCPMPPGNAAGIIAVEGASLTAWDNVIEEIEGVNLNGWAAGIRAVGAIEVGIQSNRISGLIGGGGQSITAAGLWVEDSGSTTLTGNLVEKVAGGTAEPYCYGFLSPGGSAAGILSDRGSGVQADNNVVQNIRGGDGTPGLYGDASSGDASGILARSAVRARHNTLYSTAPGQPGNETSNLGTASGVRAIGASVSGLNNAIVGHEIGIAAEEGGTSALDFSGLWANGTDYQGAAPGVHDLSAAPRFQAPADGDLHLTAGSPFVNAGSADAGLTDDYDGDQRPMIWGGSYPAIPDIGADEYWPALEGSVKAAVAPDALPGSIIEYTLTLVNREPGYQLYKAQMTDALPAGLTFVAGSLSASAGDIAESDGVIIWSLATWPPGQTVTLMFAARIDSLPTSGRIVNRAVIRANSQFGGRSTRWLQAVTLTRDQRQYLPLIRR